MYYIYGLKRCRYTSRAIAILEKNSIDHRFIDLASLSKEEVDDLSSELCSNFRDLPKIFETTNKGVVFVGGLNEIKNAFFNLRFRL